MGDKLSQCLPAGWARDSAGNMSTGQRVLTVGPADKDDTYVDISPDAISAVDSDGATRATLNGDGTIGASPSPGFAAFTADDSKSSLENPSIALSCNGLPIAGLREPVVDDEPLRLQDLAKISAYANGGTLFEFTATPNAQEIVDFLKAISMATQAE